MTVKQPQEDDLILVDGQRSMVNGRGEVNSHWSSVIGPAREGFAFNALTVDVEDYFQVQAFAGCVPRHTWDSYELRVGNNTRRVLDLFDRHQVKGTFFVLGWVAERERLLVKEIAARGHEIACHGYGHELIYEIGPERFRQDIRRAKAILEDQAGMAVIGYRAPTYSITERSLWALDILVEEGFTYDSSIFPIVHDNYGIPGAKRFPHDIETGAGAIRQFPLTTLPMKVAGKKVNIPIAGGGYLRLLPARLVAVGIRKVNEQERQPAVLYFHPWEIDPQQPRIRAGWKSTFRHYLNLHRTERKLECLFRTAAFGRMADILGMGRESLVTQGIAS